MLSPSLAWTLANPKWAAELNPVLANPLVQGAILKEVPLIAGANSINHGLGEKLRGWMVVRRRQFKVAGVPTAYDVYDTQDVNQMPFLTLQLICDAGTSTNPVLVDLYVF